MDEIEKKFNEEWEKFKKENKNKVYPNILILGISGAGKSSLINTVFGQEIAAVSNVKPQTSGFKLYKGKDYNLTVNLIDSAGYEMNQGDTYYSGIKDVINNGIDDIKNIHVIWYCISISNERIEDMDINTLKYLFNEESIRNKVCVVFTKCDQDDENSSKANNLRNIIKHELNLDINFFETSNNKEIKLELEKLVTWSADQFGDEDLRNMFIGSQMSDINLKEEAAKKVIKKAAAAAGVAGATPIPIADAIVLVPIQVKMINEIIDIYGLEKIISMNPQLAVELVMTQMGKTIVKSVVKLIPIIGQIAGVLNAAVASSLTYCLGMAVSYVCKDSLIKALRGEHVFWEDLFDMETLLTLAKAFQNEKK